jgi:hypothetical protein
LLDAQIAVVAGLERPLLLYEVWDRITGTGSQLAYVLPGRKAGRFWIGSRRRVRQFIAGEIA